MVSSAVETLGGEKYLVIKGYIFKGNIGLSPTKAQLYLLVK